MIEWPETLIEAIARRRCVLYLGAGVSANAKNEYGKSPATWRAFLESLLDKKKLKTHRAEIEKLIEKDDYLLACEVIVNKIGEREFGDAVAAEFRKPGYRPAEIHEVVFGLDSKIVITTNVDKIYEQYASSETNSTIVVKTYSDKDLAMYLRSNDYLIIRAHGNVDKPGEMIFTHGQYSKARNAYSHFYKVLDALILTHTFIFIGCGIKDPDIELLLENANFLYEYCPPHFMIASEQAISPNLKEIIDKNRNLSVLSYSNDSGVHEELLNSLKELKELVETKRAEIAKAQTW